LKCKLSKTTIDYEIRGKGKPILMIHGYRVDRNSLIGAMEPILIKKAGFKRVYFDLPGMGKTKSGKLKNSDDMLETILEFIDEIIPNEKFIIVGYSYGGYLARGVIAEKANYIEGVFLLAPVIYPQIGHRNLPKHNPIFIDEKIMKKLIPKDAQEFSSIAVIQNIKTWERFKNEILPGLRSGEEEFLFRLFKEGYSFSFSVDEKYDKIYTPTLILAGRQDSFVGYIDMLDILEKYPRATFAVLDKAGHILQIEQPKLFTLLVNEWLNRISEENYGK